MSDGTREQLFIYQLTIDGTDCGVWDKSSVWTTDTTSTKYRSGGQQTEESLGGSPTYPDITLDRNYRLARDHSIMPFLRARAGKGAFTLTKQALDRDFNAYGTPEVAVGLFKTVSSPAGDSTSNNAAMVTVVLETNSIVAT